MRSGSRIAMTIYPDGLRDGYGGDSRNTLSSLRDDQGGRLRVGRGGDIRFANLDMGQ